MAQRISRAKQRIKASRRAVRAAAGAGAAPSGCSVVLHVLYLIFNEGYTATSGPDLQRAELTAEAIRLTRAVHRLLPDDGEVAGLLALMLLTDARRPARTGPDGALVPLAEQDRTRWDRGADRRGRRAGHRRPGRGAARPVPAAGGDRRGARRGADAPTRPTGAQILGAVRAARADRAQPDGDAQPRGRRGDGRTARRPASTCWPRSTPTSGWPATTGSPPSAPTCCELAGDRAAAARRLPRRPPAAPPACPSSATSKPAPPNWRRPGPVTVAPEPGCVTAGAAGGVREAGAAGSA